MSWTHLGDTWPKARKNYRCELCALPIPKAAEYVARCGVSAGELVTFRMHVDCEKVTRLWDPDDWICDIDHSEFRRELKEFLTANNMLTVSGGRKGDRC